MVSRKRARSEMEPAADEQMHSTTQPGLLERLRNCWEFACLMQYIFTFGKVMKIDEDFGIEDLETECLKVEPSPRLLDIGLSLLKFVSSHRGLTLDNFDEYTRRQYNAKAPHIPNPFGHDEEPKHFRDFDIFLKLRVLHQLSVWTFWNPDRIREKMPEQKENEQTQWRIEELGYDREDRLYYVLDDNRLYRRTDPPIAPARPWKPKANTKKAKAAARAAKRRKLEEEDADDEEGTSTVLEAEKEDPSGGFKWECIAITLPEYQQFIDNIRKSKDPNEQILRDRLTEEVLPVIEKLEEAQERKRQKMEKELYNMQLLAGAKRSSRIADKHEKERLEKEAAELARRREEELIEARKEEKRRRKIEEERQYRMMGREQRIKDRENKRALHEAEMIRLAEEQKKLENGEGRVSERHLKAELDKRKKTLEELSEEEDWVFDCSGCGVHGENWDDGSHSVACEKCNVWQHSQCLGIPKEEAEKDDFHFLCSDCKRREEEAKQPKLPPLKFRVGSSASPPSSSTNATIDKRDRQTSPSIKTRDDSDGQSRPPTIQGESTIADEITLQNQSKSREIAHSRSSAMDQPTGSSNGLSNRNPPSFVTPSSPSKLHNGASTSSNPQQQLNGVQSTSSAFSSYRPSSSHSNHSQSMTSPIHTRPSMSPTQGNRDVGLLAGIPPSSNAALPSTPFGQEKARFDTNPSPYTSFSSYEGQHSHSTTTPNGHHISSLSPPPGSQGMSLSGISPTKNSPRTLTSASLRNAPVLPPVSRLEPSPKLMGRASPDAPIPRPVKLMTPEQEERRQRENEGMGNANGMNGQQPGASFRLSLPPLGSWNKTTDDP